jgi:large subunit ribosomal protein L15e
MALYKHIRNLYKHPTGNLEQLWKKRLVEWRREQATLRIARPTRIDRARSLGYKAKQGFIVVRQRVERGGHQRPKIRAGRRSKHFGRRVVLSKSYQQIAEERANKRFRNCEVLNSYYVAKDGKYFWYEIILVDKSHPAILADKNINWIFSGKHKGRVYRGKTSAGKHSRGLMYKGKGAEKLR